MNKQKIKKILINHFEEYNYKTFTNKDFNDISDKIQFHDMIEEPFGGVRFIIFEKFDNKWDYPYIRSVKSLIDDNKFTPGTTYQVCTNIVGDYHY